jgi:hypothetical protein
MAHSYKFVSLENYALINCYTEKSSFFVTHIFQEISFVPRVNSSFILFSVLNLQIHQIVLLDLNPLLFSYTKNVPSLSLSSFFSEVVAKVDFSLFLHKHRTQTRYPGKVALGTNFHFTFVVIVQFLIVFSCFRIK